VNRCISHLQIVTTNNSCTIADFRTRSHSTLSLLNLLSLVVAWLFLCNVFTRRLLVTNLNDGESSASVVRWLILHSWTFNSSQLLLNWTIVRLSLYRLGSNLTENTCHVSECVFIGPLPSIGYGADHIESTSSVVRMRDGADYIENTSSNTFCIAACAYFGRCLEMGLHVTIIYNV
jgi:hypothetical protein